jgi:hypothetical protein
MATQRELHGTVAVDSHGAATSPLAGGGRENSERLLERFKARAV